MGAVEQLKQISVRDLVTWLVVGMAAVTFALVQDAMSDVAATVEKIDEKLDDHLIHHPDHELDKRLSVLESQTSALSTEGDDNG